MIKCISFDFDRTLAHVTPLTHHLIPELLAQKGINVSDEEFKQHCIYLRNNLPEELKDRLCSYGTLSKEDRTKFIKEYNKARIDLLDLSTYDVNISELKDWLVSEIFRQQKKLLYDDVKDTIIKLKSMGLKLYILSGNSSDGIIEILEQASLLTYFENIITVDKYQLLKSENFKHLIKYAKVKPEEILHIGDDIITDGQAPESNGINVLIIERPKQLLFNDCKKHNFRVISKLLDIFDYI